MANSRETLPGGSWIAERQRCRFASYLAQEFARYLARVARPRTFARANSLDRGVGGSWIAGRRWRVWHGPSIPDNVLYHA
jgi:hypothetical protein